MSHRAGEPYLDKKARKKLLEGPHVHHCMRCGQAFYCLSPQTCNAQAVRVTGTPSRRMGKTAAQEKAIAEFLKKNPQAVIARVGPEGTRIEKPVEGEVVGLPALPAPPDRGNK